MRPTTRKSWWSSVPNVPADPPCHTRAGPPCRLRVQRRGPLLVDGPVEVELEDGTTVRSDRFRVALCTCRRSRRYPWCDTSHRERVRDPSP
nr:CDGSH iron-sulfur domain-containing protein [Streptomyces thermoviolaceus]